MYRNLENLLEYDEQDDIAETLGLSFQASYENLCSFSSSKLVDTYVDTSTPGQVGRALHVLPGQVYTRLSVLYCGRELSRFSRIFYFPIDMMPHLFSFKFIFLFLSLLSWNLK